MDSNGSESEHTEAPRVSPLVEIAKGRLIGAGCPAMLLGVTALPMFLPHQNGGGRLTACMSNLHQISLALRLYRQDWHGFPPDRYERPIPPGERWYDPTKTRYGYGLGALYPDYVSSPRCFVCFDDQAGFAPDDGRPIPHASYDGEDPAAGPGGNMAAPACRLYSDAGVFAPGASLRYARVWKTRRRGKTVEPDPAEPRQLIRRHPPPDTVVAWCPYHRRHREGARLRHDDQDLLVFLNGETRCVNAQTGSGHAAPLRPE